METEELTKLVDDIYKNILEKFNPGTRQLIQAGKAYLKALHGANAAFKSYMEAMSRIARQAQLGTWGGSQDVGTALMRIVEVYKEIQEHDTNILKAFYVDLLVPLETNLEKDTKVIQSEQKKFLQHHKMRFETYTKAAATIKKQKKKLRNTSKSGVIADKELKNMEILEEEKSKLDNFCEQSLKMAMTQERRRYGFILERQCSLAKHYASFYDLSLASLNSSLVEWRAVASTREYLPPSVEDLFATQLKQVNLWRDDEENNGSELTLSSQIRKTRSMDSSCQELRSRSTLAEQNNQNSMSVSANLAKARSEANIHTSMLSLSSEVPETPGRPKSMTPSSRGTMINGEWNQAIMARAAFAYISSGENQLSFYEGDLITLIGEKRKGWQFGENIRSRCTGWFPLAYTEVVSDELVGSFNRHGGSANAGDAKNIPPSEPPPSRPSYYSGHENIKRLPKNMNHNVEHSPISSSYNGHVYNNNINNNNSNNMASSPLNQPKFRKGASNKSSNNLPGVPQSQPPVPPLPPSQNLMSLHSSNDSGFSNEPPVQPDIDYSDDEDMRQNLRKITKKKPVQQSHNNEQERGGHERFRNSRSFEHQDWDSWKSLPPNEKSWHMYRAAMTEYWSETSNGHRDATKSDYQSQQIYHDVKTQDDACDVEEDKDGNTVESVSNCAKTDDRKSKAGKRNSMIDDTLKGSNKKLDKNHHFVDEDDLMYANGTSKNKHESMVTRDAEINDVAGMDEKYIDGYYNQQRDSESKSQLEEDISFHRKSSSTNNINVINNNKNSMEVEKNSNLDTGSSESDSDDGTLADEELPGKVDQIAQKLEQTAQKYARGEHDSPKPLQRKSVKDMERNNARSDCQQNYNGYISSRGNFIRNSSITPELSQSSALSYERENASNHNGKMNYIKKDGRLVDRPCPPSVEAPERPVAKNSRIWQDNYREMSCGKDMNELMMMTGVGEGEKMDRSRFSNVQVDKDRGYESNFETTLERTKILERHPYLQEWKIREHHRRHNQQNDKNNNTLQIEKSHKGTKPVQTRSLHRFGPPSLPNNNGFSEKSAKLNVKRTKSFWRFRRDSDVLEGMALWQHRSLVDIPKLVKKEKDKDWSRQSSSDRSVDDECGSRYRTLERKNSDSTITKESVQKKYIMKETSSADRINRIEKSMQYLIDQPNSTLRSNQEDYKHNQKDRLYFGGNVSRKAIIENGRKRNGETQTNSLADEFNKEDDRHEKSRKQIDDSSLIQQFTENEASDEESNYSCIIIKDQVVSEKQLLPRTKLKREGHRNVKAKNTGSWDDDPQVNARLNHRKKKRNFEPSQ